MSRVDKRWLVAGALLDAVGLALVVWSLPQGGMLLAAGAGLLLAGAWAISRAAAGLSASAAPSAPARHAAGDWTAEPELRGGEPRPVRLKFQPRMIAAIWMLTIAVAAGFAYERIWKLNPRPAGLEIVDSQGLDVQGTVHRKETRSGAEGRARHYIYYNFQDQTGAELRSSTTVTREIFDRFAEHDAIQVRYLAGDPSVHYLPQATRDPLARPVATALGVGMALVLILLEGLRRRHKRLTAAGTVVAGLVESLKRRGATRIYQARYEADGEVLRVQAQERNLRRREGDLVSVLVDPADPNSALVYAASIYRAIEPGGGENSAQRSRADSR